jgi:hypothetical protein
MDARLEVFTVGKIQVEVLWFVMLCNVVVGYKRFGGSCFLLQGEVNGTGKGA